MVSQTREAEACKSLWMKAGELSEEERCDILLSLAGLIEDGQSIGNGPEDILLDGDNQVQIARIRQSGRDLLFQAPELIWQPGGSPKPGREQAWFMLGMLAYYIYCGADYYSDRQIRVLESQEQLFSKRYVISVGEVTRIPFGKAVSQLTAMEPGERVQGLAALLAYLSEQMPETAKIRYLCGGRTVHEEERILSQDIENLTPGGRISLNGTVYRTASSGPVQIPYRPGTHRYDVEVVTEGSGEEQDGGVRGFVHKPSADVVRGGLSEGTRTEDRWLYVKNAHLMGDPSQGEQMIRVLKLGSEDREKRLELHMHYPDSQIAVFRKNSNGVREPVKEIAILRESDAQISRCFVQLRYKGDTEHLWITVEREDNTVLRRYGIDLREME